MSERTWQWGVWHAADDDWHAELQRRYGGSGRHRDEAGEHAEKIPKRIHQIWLGPNEIPQRCLAWMETWRVHHPDWSYRLWRDADVAAMALENERAFQEASNYGEKSDILRYELLERFGGVYVDIDMECLQPFDDLSRYAFAVGISNTACVELNNAVIAASPGHPILKRLIEKIHKRTDQPRLDPAMLHHIGLLGGADVAYHLGLQSANARDNSPMSTIERTGPGLMTRTFMEAIGWTSKSSEVHVGFLPVEDQELAVALPVDVLYPLANDAVASPPAAYPPQSLAVHYWQRSWVRLA